VAKYWRGAYRTKIACPYISTVVIDGKGLDIDG